jgi:trk system potassium uptake protein TrkH
VSHGGSGRLHYLGALLHVPAVVALSSAVIAFAFGERFAVAPFALSGLAAVAIGQALMRAFRPPAQGIDELDAMMIAALGWLLVPLAGSLALMGVGRAAGPEWPEAATLAAPTRAFFEAMSGFTGTGLTMVERPSGLPHALQWWRSLAQWVGGLGVIVLMLAILRPGRAPLHLFQAEARDERALPTVKSTVRAFLGIYLVCTAGGVAALLLAGEPAWRALNHGLTALATGGFTITDRGHVPGIAAQGVLMALFVVGALSFNAHERVVRERRPAAWFADGQHRTFWLLLGLAIVAVAFERRLDADGWRWMESAFQATSALCTAGFQTASLDAWSDAAKALIVAAMVIGGAAGSTAGGIKTARAHLLARGIRWRYRRIVSSRREVPRHVLDGRGLSEQTAIGAVEGAAVLVASWVGLLFLGTLVLLHFVPSGTGLASVLLEAASAQGNVGLSTGITGPELATPGKLVLMLLMWAGRLEILPVLVLLRRGH